MTRAKTVRYIAAGMLAVLVVLGAAAYVVVHTEAFNRFLVAKIVQQARTRAGIRLEIGSLAIQWDKLDVDVYNFAVYRDNPDERTPFVRGDHLGIGLKIVSLLKREINLQDLILDRPVLDLRVASNGATNLPKSQSTGKSSFSPDELFDMAVGHVAIRSGEILYRDQQVPISAELDGFRANVTYGLLARDYKGELAYDRGRIVYSDYNPFDHSADVQFTATRQNLKIDQLMLAAANSRVVARATLTDYMNPNITGNYDATFLPQEIDQMIKTSLPAGTVSAAGSIRYQFAANRSFLDTLYADGKFSSPRLIARADQVSVPVNSVRGDFSLDQGNLRVNGVEAVLLGGHLSAQAEFLSLSQRSSTHLAADLSGISLQAVGDALPPGSYERLHFVGRANAKVDAGWSGGISNLMATSRIAIDSPPQNQLRPGTIPVRGLVNVNYDAKRDVASFGQSHLQTGKTEIAITGTLSKQSKLSVQATAGDLHELSALISEIQSATSASSIPKPGTKPFNVQGTAQFTGQVSGSIENPRVQGQLIASNIQAEGSTWQSIRSSIDLSPAGIALQNGQLVSKLQLASNTRSQVAFSGRAALNHWSFGPANSISLQATAANLSIADLERLGKLNYPVSGTLSGNLSLAGSEQNPSGHGSFQITKASAWGETINNLSINLQGNGTSLDSTAQLQVPAGALTATVNYSPDDQRYRASVKTSGLKLDQIKAVQARRLDVGGLLILSANGQGSLKDPQVSADVTLSQFTIRGQKFSAVDTHLNIAQQHANFTVKSTVTDGDLEARGDIALTGAYETTASIDLRALPVGALLAEYLPGNQALLNGQADVHATVNGPLKNPAQLQAHVEISTFNVSFHSLQLALARPLRLDYSGGTATLQETEFKGTGTDLTLQGVIPVKSTTGFNIAAKGTVDMSLLQGLTTGIKSSGRLDLNFTGRGDLSHPQMQGQVKVENAYLSTDSLPVAMEGVNGTINMTGNRIAISELKGAVGGGTLSVQGGMVYGKETTFNLVLNANSVRVRYPEGIRSVVTSNLNLNGTSAASTLSGRVLIDRLSFTQQFDLANFVSQFDTPSVPSSSPFQQNMTLRIAVQSAQNIDLTSSQLSMQGAANLNIVGTLANPVVLGRSTLTGGDIFFLGKRYEVQSGTIEFANPVRTQPVVNLSVTTTVEQYNITLNFNGPVDQLRTNYTSVPPLSPADIINLLALGQTAEESATSNTPASVGAESVVAQGVAGQFSSRIQKLAGLSQLTIDPMAGSNQTNPGSQVAIQERATGNILLTFGTDVTSTQATTVQVQYRLTPETSISVVRDQFGGYAVDVKLHKTF